MAVLRTLFKIREDLLTLLDSTDPETGEYLAGYDEIHALQMEREEKRKSVAIYIKSLKVFLDALKKARDDINKRIKQTEKRIEYLSEMLKADLDGEKINEPEVVVRYHTTRNVVQIAEGTKLPDEFMRIKVTEEPNKTALKEAILEGEIIEGVQLIDKVSLVIK